LFEVVYPADSFFPFNIVTVILTVIIFVVVYISKLVHVLRKISKQMKKGMKELRHIRKPGEVLPIEDETQEGKKKTIVH
jgi:uncharacterized membrane protein (DUF106 family)